MFKRAPKSGKFTIGQKFGRYEFPPTTAKEGQIVKYEFDTEEYDFLQIFEVEAGKLILKQGRIPEDYDTSKAGKHSILIKMIDSNGTVSS